MTDHSDRQEAFEAWRDTLRSFCGHFEVTPGADMAIRHGSFGKRMIGGLEMSHIRTNYDRVVRDASSIRRDDVDCLYLVNMISGRKRLTHNGVDIVIEAGDSVLLDTTRPMWGHYGAEGLEFATLHIPRTLMFRDAGDGEAIEIGVPRRASGSRGGTLNAALAHVRAKGLSAEAGQSFVIDLARLVFRADPAQRSLHRFGQRADRIVALRALIDRHAGDGRFSLGQLAHLSGLSERQVQRDLQSDATSFSREVQAVRLGLVERGLLAAIQRGKRPHVAEIAYDAGFNDLSHFNRVFRRAHGCSPRDYAQSLVAD